MLQKAKLISLLRSLLLIGAGGFYFISPCTAQRAPFFTSGTEFAFPPLGRQHPFVYPGFDKGRSSVQITALAQTCGRFEIPGRGYSFDFTLKKDSSLLLTLPLDTLRFDSVSDIGMTIRSTLPVQVVFATDIGMLDSTLAAKHSQADPIPFADSLNREATAITPTSMASSDFLLNIPNIHNNLFPQETFSQFWVHSFLDSTLIDINLTNTRPGSNLPVNAWFTIPLPAHSSFYTFLQFLSTSGHKPALDGSILKSSNNKPFLVFSGRLAQMFGNCIDLNQFPVREIDNRHVLDQSKPIVYGDTLYAIAQIENHMPNIYAILALEDSSEIKLNGTSLGFVNKAQQIDTCHFGEAIISSNKPILITLVRSSAMYSDPTLQPNASTNAPFSITMPGSAELMKRSVLKPFSENYENTYVVALFTKSGDTGNFNLDGQLLPLGSWKPFAARPGWAWAQLEVSDKTHIMESSGDGFMGYHYSYAKKRPNYYYYPSYGYCLIESKTVPEDSLHFYIKTENTAKEKFRDFNESVCVGEQVQLYPNMAHHIGWQWNFGDGNDTLQLIKNENGKPIFHTYTQPGQYWVTVNDTGGCTAGDSVLLEVLAAPTAQFSTETFPSCDGLEVRLTNQSQGANAYSWALPGGVTTTAENPVLKYNGAEPFQITLTATVGNCSSTVTETVTPNSLSFQADAIPNVFSPNGDGQNDCYALTGQTAAYSGCFSLSIYNRWGKKVWGTQNPTDCWDGQISGAEAAAGTYYYILEVGPNEAHGSITLMR